MTDVIQDTIKHLRIRQDQLDQEGLMVGVSRQALDEVLTYLAATRAEPQWQPIETAPKDGTEFMAWWEGEFEPKVRFDQEIERYEFFGRIDYDQDGWSDEYIKGPSHWMAIPTPPKGE